MLPRRDMTLQILHCPKCGAMQPNQPRCEACGAKLPGFQSDPARISGREMAKLAALMVALFGGLVLVCAVLLYLALSWL